MVGFEKRAHLELNIDIQLVIYRVKVQLVSF